ncbi:MacS family sensor histidine kinase [Pseudonocardia sp. GCM10023141]|uniref:MacS family sensor histidine kinase n=1 Tax=Pseudonocardia sp. GCM10023141 TaxID=3252653 RepID=UPI003615831F
MTAPGPGLSTADMEQPLEPLWRGLMVYRVLTLISAIVVTLANLQSYASPAGAVGVLAVMATWTVLTGYVYFPSAATARDRRGRVALADAVVTAAVMATTPLVQTVAQINADAPVMGSIWTSGGVLACALAFGIPGGLGAAIATSVVLVAVQAEVVTELGDIQLLVLVGLTIGFASMVLRRSGDRLRRAIMHEAAMMERERLARAVHDGVLQVLGYVRRHGAELGGAAGELGKLAGEQEYALRSLLTTGPAPVDLNGRRDLAAALRMLGTSRISVSTPAHRVELPAHAADELVAVVGAALANVALHVGPEAPAWILLEEVTMDAGVHGVEISVRDAGPGIPAGRLDAAAGEGRLGVARSMRGRVHDLGGTIDCDTGPDRGTEWIIRLARQDRA